MIGTDTAFAAQMIQTVALERPQVEIGFDRGLPAPQYLRYADDMPARIMPARHSRMQNLLGEQSRMTHAAYLQAAIGTGGEPVPCAGVPAIEPPHGQQQWHYPPQGAPHADEQQVRPVATGDVLVWKRAICRLAQAAQAGAWQVLVSHPGPLSAGEPIEIGAAPQREQAIVAELWRDEVTLALGLARAHEAGEPVAAVRRFEVLAVRCWPGLAHHLELALAEVEM